MYRILLASITLGLSFGMPLSALADSYDNFIKTELAEFNRVGSEKCKEKRISVKESGAKISYDLCIFNGSPVFLRTSADDIPNGVSIFKKGKLVQLSLWEGTGGVGFRNGQPVVEWNSGEFSSRRVNWKLTAKEKSKFIEIAAKEKQILRKFGFK